MANGSAASKLWTGIDWPPEFSLRCFIGRTGQKEIWWARFPPPTAPIMMTSTGLTTTTVLEVNGDPLPAFNWNVPGDPSIPSAFDTTWFAALVDSANLFCYVFLNQKNGFGIPNDIYGGTIRSGQMWGQRKALNLKRWFSWFPGSDPFPNPGPPPAGTLNFQYRLRGIQSEFGGFEDLPPTSLKLLVP